jgi:hypothetical protein
MLVLPALVSPGYAPNDGPEQARGNGVQFRWHDIERVGNGRRNDSEADGGLSSLIRGQPPMLAETLFFLLTV